MKQEAFQARHEQEWLGFERWLNAHAGRRAQDRKLAEEIIAAGQFPLALRRLCQQLSLAERRQYSTLLIDRLRSLAQRGHQALYKPAPPRLHHVTEFFSASFPRLVREQWRAMSVSAALFFLSMLAVVLMLQLRPELIHSLFDPKQIAEFESMYDPARVVERLGRTEGTDLQMFGFYIFNNISIGFRTFASGLLAGIGSIFVLVMNGTIIGGVAGHLTAIGYGEPFWGFVAGHSAPELLAIVISGGAGLQIGMALVAPGRRSRTRALAEAGVIGAKLVLGVFAMLVLAAFIEAYWSSIVWLPPIVKYGVGALMWALILMWLWRGGRNGVGRGAGG